MTCRAILYLSLPLNFLCFLLRGTYILDEFDCCFPRFIYNEVTHILFNLFPISSG